MGSLGPPGAVVELVARIDGDDFADSLSDKSSQAMVSGVGNVFGSKTFVFFRRSHDDDDVVVPSRAPAETTATTFQASFDDVSCHEEIAGNIFAEEKAFLPQGA